MTSSKFYELCKKENELIERLEKILDKLESPILFTVPKVKVDNVSRLHSTSLDIRSIYPSFILKEELK